MIHCHAMIFSREALGGVRRMVMGTRCQYMSGLSTEYPDGRPEHRCEVIKACRHRSIRLEAVARVIIN